MLSQALEKHCIEAEPFLDKCARQGKNTAFAHTPLWICRRFSTGAPVYDGLSCLSKRKPGSDPIFDPIFEPGSDSGFRQCPPGMHRTVTRKGIDLSTFSQTRQPGSDDACRLRLPTCVAVFPRTLHPVPPADKQVPVLCRPCRQSVAAKRSSGWPRFVHAKSRHCFK